MPKSPSILQSFAFLPRVGVFSCGLFFLAATGCVKQIAYSPNEGLVEKNNVEAGGSRLEETLSRAIAPQIASAEVTAETLRYEWTQTYLGPFYQPVTTQHSAQIFFKNIARIELYENHKVFVWENNNRHYEIQFPGPEDAKEFADRVMSFRRNAIE